MPFFLRARMQEGKARRLHAWGGRERGSRNRDGNEDMRVYLCALGVMIWQVAIFAKLICPIVGGNFFLFCQNYIDASCFAKLFKMLHCKALYSEALLASILGIPSNACYFG